MRFINPLTFTALVPLPACAEQLEREADFFAELTRAARGRRPVDPERLNRFHEGKAVWRGEFEWIKANLPIGGVISHCGAPMMIVSTRYVKPSPEERGPVGHLVTVHMGSPEGLLEREYGLHQLRSMVIPD